MNLYSRLLAGSLIISTGIMLHGCAAAVVAGGATGAAVANDRRTTGTFIEDQAIEVKAYQAFRDSPDINDSSRVSVTSYNLIVLVTGDTPTEEVRRQVIDIVSNIPKVKHVYDELTIATPSSLVSRSSDSLITSKVKTSILLLENFDGTRVKVVTEKGVVYLMGLLRKDEADRATEAARHVSGVQKVVKLFQYIE